jgi:hypothetical protein
MEHAVSAQTPSPQQLVEIAEATARLAAALRLLPHSEHAAVFNDPPPNVTFTPLGPPIVPTEAHYGATAMSYLEAQGASCKLNAMLPYDFGHPPAVTGWDALTSANLLRLHGAFGQVLKHHGWQGRLPMEESTEEVVIAIKAKRACWRYLDSGVIENLERFSAYLDSAGRQCLDAGRAKGEERLHFDDTTLTISLDGESYSISNSKAYWLYKTIAQAKGPITRKSIRAEIKQGLRGNRTIPGTLNSLPCDLRVTIQSDSQGYHLRLAHKKEEVHT